MSGDAKTRGGKAEGRGRLGCWIVISTIFQHHLETRINKPKVLINHTPLQYPMFLFGGK